MRPVSLYLNKQGYATALFGYSSRRSKLEAIVTQLHQQVESLKRTHDTIHFVTHSLGGIVLRAYLGQFGQPTPICHSVMLSPPNQGSEIIDFWRANDMRHKIFKPAMGHLAMSLHTGQDSLPNQLPVLEGFSVGVIAGTRSIEFWHHPLFDQPHDGKVSVASTRLATHPHIAINATHTFLMNRPQVRSQIMHFLQKGIFL